MRILRLLGIALAVLIALLAGATIWLSLHQDRMVAVMLDAIRQRTGSTITARRSYFRFSSHLVLILDDAVVSREGQPYVRLARAEADISYHSLLFNNGTPLHALILEHPSTLLPVVPGAANPLPLREESFADVKALTMWLERLQLVAWRFALVQATLRDSAGGVLVDHLDLLGYRRRLHPGIWTFRFKGQVESVPIEHAWIAGTLHAGHAITGRTEDIAEGRLWLWDLPLAVFHGNGWRANGAGSASIAVTLHNDGSASGDGKLATDHLALDGDAISGRLELGSYQLKSEFLASTRTLAMKQATLYQGRTELAAGSIEIGSPAADNPTVTAQLTGVAIDVQATAARLRKVRRPPAYLTAALARATGGTLVLGTAQLTTTFNDLRVNLANTLRTRLKFAASIGAASFTLPPELKMPAITDMGVQLNYTDSVLTATQGTAQLGSSPAADLSARFDLTKGFDRVPYKFALGADIDVGELFPALKTLADRFQINGRDRVTQVGGRLTVTASGRGIFASDRVSPPTSYQITVEANRFQFQTRDTPGPVQVRRGVLTAKPHELKVERLEIAATGGEMTIDGELRFGEGRMTVQRMTAEMHQIPAGLWLPLAVDPDEVRLQGAVGGKITVKSDPAKPNGFIADGRLVVGRGSLAFGFLRSPIKFQAATLEFAKHSMSLAMPASMLEGGGLNFHLAVADLTKPTLSLEVLSRQMDFEVMKFIHMPWEPSGPPPEFPIPVVGHIEVARGSLEGLHLTNVRADFFRKTDTSWRVYNFTGDTLKGSFRLDLFGRARDQWTHIVGKLAGIDLASIFLLSEHIKTAPIRGKLTASADLWAETRSDFFQSANGNVTFAVQNGRIERLTLLSRMLQLIDLKSWLTAQVPDPRQTGLPFETAGADFKGTRGTFYTDDFILEGPVIDMTATGSVQLDTGQLDLDIAAIPVTTVGWLVNKIPLIGSNVAAGTSNLLAAYFHVSGVVGNPSVQIKPITSVTEFVKKMLFLPLNIIRPNTVK